MDLIVTGSTDIGLVRKTNQDSFCINKELNFLAVADGIGGHAGGEYASKFCIQAIEESMQEDFANEITQQNPREAVRKAITLSNNKIFDEGRQKPELQGMGTTVELLYFTKSRLFIGHVGDSRVYLLARGLIWQLTRDHSVVEEKLRAGLIDREQAKKEVLHKNIITRSVGFEKQLQIETYEKEIIPGDAYLICSDGLSNMCSNQEMLDIYSQNTASTLEELEETTQEMVQRAKENGGDDNITVVLAKFF